MQPAAPPPSPAELRGMRQPSSTGELLPSLDDLDAAIGTPGMQDPLASRGATTQVPSGVPFGEPCAGFGIRFLAYLMDALLMGAVLTAAVIFSGSDPLYTSLASLVSAAVIFFGWSIWGTTPGKRVFNLYLHGEDGQTGIGFLRAFIRMVAYSISFALFGIGFLMIAFTKDHRGLHDRIARTWVYRHSS